VLQGLHQRLVHLGVSTGDRLTEIATANSRLAALAQGTTDSHKVLTDLLAAWPEEGPDALRSVVQVAESLRETLGDLDDKVRTALEGAVNHPTLGMEVQAHLDLLQQRLAAAQAEQPLTREWVQTWNRNAHDLVRRLIVVQPPPPKPPDPPPPPEPPAPVGDELLFDRTIDPGDADDVSMLLAEIRRVLSDRPEERLHVALVRRGARK
jgi:hypothetical protein